MERQDVFPCMGKIFVLSSKNDVDIMKDTLKSWMSTCPTFQVLYCDERHAANSDISDVVAIWVDVPARGLPFSFDLLCLLADHCPVFLNAVDVHVPVQMIVGLARLTYMPTLARIVNRICLVSYEHALVPNASVHTYVETERAVYTIAYCFLSKLYEVCHESSRQFLLCNHPTPTRISLGLAQINIFHAEKEVLRQMRMLNASLSPAQVFQLSKTASTYALHSERGFEIWKRAVEDARTFSEVVFQLDDKKLCQIDPDTLRKWLDLSGRQRITLFVENQSKRSVSDVNKFLSRRLCNGEVHYMETKVEFVLALGASFAHRGEFREFSLELRQARNEDLANDLLAYAVRMLRKP